MENKGEKMAENVISMFTKDYYPNRAENIYDDLFQQYGRVVIDSLVTSFGLDKLLIQDQYGGDVDTIFNVNKIGEDPNMTYKNSNNAMDYENRGDYISEKYHKHKVYIAINRKVKESKLKGELVDAYTGKPIERNGKSDLDHIISAKEIHDNRARVLAGLSGEDLANSPENLVPTNPRTNRTKKADSMEKFQKKYADEYTMEELERMSKYDKEAREAFDAKVSKTYYTSTKFRKDLLNASANVGVKMGVRQGLGFVLTEVIFTTIEEIRSIERSLKLKEMFEVVINGIKKGIERTKEKYKDIIKRVGEGVIGGILSSITTTLINTFFTTSKNLVRIIRQVWASLVEASKILLLNPDNLLFGERMRAFLKVLTTSASVLVGITVSEMINKTAIITLPYVGETLQIFLEVLATGLTSCTLIYFLDRNEIVNKIISFLNRVPTMSNIVNFYKEQARYFEEYAAEILQMDIDTFKNEIDKFNEIYMKLEKAETNEKLNSVLLGAYKELGIELPWKGDFSSFMGNRKNTLVFK